MKDIVNDIINYIAQFPTSDNYMTRRRDKLFSPLDFKRLLSFILVVQNISKGKICISFPFDNYHPAKNNCIKTKLQKRGFSIKYNNPYRNVPFIFDTNSYFYSLLE